MDNAEHFYSKAIGNRKHLAIKCLSLDLIFQIKLALLCIVLSLITQRPCEPLYYNSEFLRLVVLFYESPPAWQEGYWKSWSSKRSVFTTAKCFKCFPGEA